MNDYKYLIIFRIPANESIVLKRLMNQIARKTKPNPPYLPPPYERMDPYVTFHKPLVGVNENKLRNILQGAVLQITQTRIRLTGLDHFGKQYIVAPVHATLNVSTLLVTLSFLLQSLPEYKHGEFDGDNMLHVTMAEKLYTVFDTVWPKVRKMKFEMDIVFKEMELVRKPINDGRWETVEIFYLPKE